MQAMTFISEVPTVANGGVSPDGLLITYTLRTGIQWSNGEPFTCDDVLFTYEAIMHPDSGAVSTSGYDQTNHLSLWAVWGKKARRVYLPLVVRKAQ